MSHYSEQYDEWRGEYIPPIMSPRQHPQPAPITAHGFLEQAAREMGKRAATYDKPEGERSMGKTVAAFNALTGHTLTEQEGWQFMELLKIARSNQGEYRADSFVDGAAYAALAGEAAARSANGGAGHKKEAGD